MKQAQGQTDTQIPRWTDHLETKWAGGWCATPGGGMGNAPPFSSHACANYGFAHRESSDRGRSAVLDSLLMVVDGFFLCARPNIHRHQGGGRGEGRRGKR